MPAMPAAAALLAALLLIPLGVAPEVVNNNAMVYLSQFGYIKASSSNISSLMDLSSVQKALKEFQEFAGLNITGELDNETIKTMQLPRCGVKDKVGHSFDSRSKRYALQGSRWKVKKLTYRLHKYPRNLKTADVDDEIARAFKVWSDYTDLTFEQKTSGPVHIDISFERGEHGDGDPFDGPGGTLAHAYFPVFGGDAHFDASESWSIKSYRGTNLFQVAAHEFGHSLGLSHSDVRHALMAPFYRGYDPNFELHEDDVQAIQILYGPKTQGEDAENTVNTDKRVKPSGARPSEDAILCKDPKIDVIFNSADDRETYVFKGDLYWQLTDEAIASGYPRKISEGWPKLPGSIDAAFTYKNGKTYFFKGKHYWRYKGNRMEDGYPKLISDGFAGIPDDVDAALVWSGNGKIYFYKGSKFWRFDPTQKPPVKSTYPKKIANWEGLPDSLDAAFKYKNGYSYFFKGDSYYRFNDRDFTVDRADPAFPRSSGYWWFGCKSAPKGTTATGNDRAFQNKNGESAYSHLQHDDVSDYGLDADSGNARRRPGLFFQRH